MFKNNLAEGFDVLTSLGKDKDKTFKSIGILKPPIAVGAIAFCSASLATGTWALTAKIPEKATGIGVLQPVQSVVRIKARNDGILLYPFKEDNGVSTYSSPQWSEKAYAFVEDPQSISDNQLPALAQEIIKDIKRFETARVDLAKYSGVNYSKKEKPLEADSTDVIAIINNPSLKAGLFSQYRKLSSANKSYKEQLELQEVVQKSREQVAIAEKQMMAPIKELLKQGAVGQVAFNEQVAKAAAAEAERVGNTANIKQMRRDIEANSTELRTTLAEFIRKSLIFAPGKTEVVNFIAPQWAEVQNNDALMTLSWQKEVNPNTIPVYLQAKPSTQINVGMEVLLTPIGFSPSEIGGIKGKITSFNPLFLSNQDLSLKLGSEGYGSLLAPANGAFEIKVELKREEQEKLSSIERTNNRSGYQWNNRSNPPIPPREGLILNAQIITRYRSPISMLLPILNEGIGLNTPVKLIDLQNGVTKK